MLQDFYIKASPLKKFFMKLIVLYGFGLTTAYLIFRAYYINFSPLLTPFSLLLYAAEVHTVVLLYGMLYSLWPRKYKEYVEANKRKDLTINVFIPIAGEPFEVVKDTIDSALTAAKYYVDNYRPNKIPRVIVLDDGKARGKEVWKDVQKYCQKVGVYHIARETNEGFKAGNINNGLKFFPSDNPHDTIDCFLDSDFCAKPNFIPELLKPLADDSVDFVQSPQKYKNMNTWVAKAAGAHQIFFFDFICPAKAYDNALFLCGTNYAIRREALVATGGVDNRFVTEDYATSIKLHLLGKKGVFVSKVLALGMAPMNLKEYFNQQTRWCKGCLDANSKYFKELAFGPLNWRQKFHYFLSTVYYFIGIRDMILVLAPVTFLFGGVSLIRANSIEYLTLVYLPLMIYNFAMFFLTFNYPFKSLVLDVVSFPVFAAAFLSSVFKRNLPFTVTIKKYEKENPFRVYKVQLGIALLLIVGLIYSSITKTDYNAYGKFINHFWAFYSSFFLMVGFVFIIKENVSLNVSIVSKLPKFQPLPNYVINIARIAIVVAISVGVGLYTPIVYNAYGSESQKLLANKYADTVEAVNSLGKTENLEIPSTGAYYGYYLPELNSHPAVPEVNVINSEQPSLTMYYQDWNENSLFDIEFMKKLDRLGVVPVITWEPMDTINKDAEINKKGAPEMLITNGNYDSYIRTWAKYAKSYKKPFFLRFAHEMNSNWYPWADSTNEGAEKYKAMWIHVHNIFEEEGVSNSIWVWTPNNTNEYGITKGVSDFYPGSEYVDWVGYSAFNWGDSNWKKSLWRSFNFMSYDIYNELSKLDKPIMVAETSSVSGGGDKTGWFNDTFVTFIPNMPNIKAVIVFNQNIDGADFSVSSGMAPYFALQEYIVDNPYYLKEPILTYK